MQNPRTARSQQSIWRLVSETVFREKLVELERRTNAVPIEPQVFDPSTQYNLASELCDVGHTLPYSIEQQVANDFAYIAAVQEGAQSVAAVCVEETVLPAKGLKLRFAAVDSLDRSIRDGLRSVADQVELIAHMQNSNSAVLILARPLTDLHFHRLLGRLRSVKWNKPPYLIRSHKKPLWQDFANTVHRVQFVYPSKQQSSLRRDIEGQLRNLARIYEAFELVELNPEENRREMLNMVAASYEFCMHSAVRQFNSDLEKLRPTAQIAAALKCLRQVEKIGAFIRIAQSLIHAARMYPELFVNIDLDFLPPYESIPTDIAYESWAKTCHIHAEIQLIVYYDVQFAGEASSNSTPPRLIGTSKYLCFLCFLFIKYHGRYFAANTHGRLYDQWTLPDQAEFNDNTRDRYQTVIRQMFDHVTAMAQTPPVHRVEPMTSRQNLLSEFCGHCSEESINIAFHRTG